jgi:hypothetical protein
LNLLRKFGLWRIGRHPLPFLMMRRLPVD